MSNIGINGFGRIGRAFLRCAMEMDADISAINQPSADPKYIAYLFKHDSSHGRFYGKVCSDDKHLIVNKQKIRIFSETDPKKVPWKDAGVDWVVESSGIFTTTEKASLLLQGGAKKVLISAPSKDAPMYVCGVNLDKYNPKDKIISMASCTTNCLAPLAKVVHENFGISEGLMTTVHAVTLSQKLIDGTAKKAWRDGRGGFQNIIPSSTGAAKAVTKVIPELQGRLTGMAFRVPVACGSVVDLTARICKSADMDTINLAIREASEGSLRGILGYTEEEIVSSDIIGTHCTSVYDAKAGIALNDNFVKLISWYDNETGYATKLVELLKYVQRKDCEAAEKEKQLKEKKSKEKDCQKGDKQEKK
nr:glyceraldehyde-3-phosphate dehydrogenase 2-like [Leptinotarsa decemlineata]